jgi:D-tyrosyl-tRNA(Tyr) deacylase
VEFALLIILTQHDANIKNTVFIFRARKILGIRLFEDERGKRWNLSVKDKGYEILCISQFTLYHVLKGNKLDFHNAMATEKSEAFYQEFIGHMRAQYQADLIKG